MTAAAYPFCQFAVLMGEYLMVAPILVADREERGPPHPHSARTAGAPCRLAGVRQPHPHLLAHVFQMTEFTWEDLGLREDFVHPNAQKTPRSPNAPEH